MRKLFLVVALVLVVLATGVFGFTHRPGTARAATATVTGYSLCEVNSTQCLDLQGDKFVDTNPIVFYSYNSTEERFRWHLAFLGSVTYSTTCKCGSPFANGQLDFDYAGVPYYWIEKSTLTGHDGCIGSSYPSTPYDQEAVVWWIGCTTNTENTEWLYPGSGYGFVSVGMTDYNGVRSVLSRNDHDAGNGTNCSDSNGTQAIVAPSSYGCGAEFTYNGPLY